MDSRSARPDAAAIGDKSLPDALQEAATHHHAGRLPQAEALYRAVLAKWPDDPDASHNLGVLVMQRGGTLEEALPLFRNAWTINPTNSHHGMSYLQALVRAGRDQEARELHAEGRKRGFTWPSPDAMRAPAAASSASAPASAAQDEAELARAFQRNDFARFEALARGLVQRHPERGAGWKALGFLAMRHGRREEALHAMANAARTLPRDPEPLFAMGTLLASAQRFAQAEAVLRQAVVLKPDWAQAHAWLGQVLQRQRRLVEAEASMRAAWTLSATNFDALYGLGNVLLEQARLDEAIAFYRSAIAIQPENLQARSTLLFALYYAAVDSPEALLAEAKAFGTAATARVKSPFTQWRCAPAGSPLRVGLVSGDLGEHPVGFFLEAVLEQAQATGIEWIGYPTMIENDELSARLRRSLHAWHPLAGLSDEDAARRVHDDGVHLLIDLSGHSANNRLAMFAWQPAPAQASWLGYFATTGLQQIDAVIADEVGVPPLHRRWFTEEVRYMPQTRLCFSAPRTSMQVSPLPAVGNGFVTFGSFQNAAKITDATLRLWSLVLQAVPGARLRLQNTSLGDSHWAARFLERLSAHGIETARVTLHGGTPREAYFAAHAEVDILLDSSPYPGGTTTCEALWMGVPTVTLAGDSMIARQGASLLSAAGLPDWIAESESGYVDLARRKAADPGALASLRATLRQRVGSSPLFDAPRFASDLSTLLHALWKDKGVARLGA